MFFLDGLKKRSPYAVCVKPYQAVLNKGDLVKMGAESTGETLQKTMWCYGQLNWGFLGGVHDNENLFVHRNKPKDQERGRFPAGQLVHSTNTFKAFKWYSGDKTMIRYGSLMPPNMYLYSFKIPFIKSEVEIRNFETITKKPGSKENVHTLEKFASTNFRSLIVINSLWAQH